FSSWLWAAGITGESPKNKTRTPNLGSRTLYYPVNRQPEVVASGEKSQKTRSIPKIPRRG
ncbi:MAG TPA: hypothetical protein VGJ05_03425, partial [Fimbriiglobus sp.]